MPVLRSSLASWAELLGGSRGLSGRNTSVQTHNMAANPRAEVKHTNTVLHSITFHNQMALSSCSIKVSISCFNLEYVFLVPLHGHTIFVCEHKRVFWYIKQNIYHHCIIKLFYEHKLKYMNFVKKCMCITVWIHQTLYQKRDKHMLPSSHPISNYVTFNQVGIV